MIRAYWNFLKQFYCALWSLQQFAQIPEGEGRTRLRESQNSNSPEGVGEKEGSLSCTTTVLDASSLCCWVTPCWCFSLPFKVEDGWHITSRAALQRAAEEKSGLAGCPPAIGPDFLHILDEWLCFSPEAVQPESTQGRAQLGTEVSYEGKPTHRHRRCESITAPAYAKVHAGRKIRTHALTGYIFLQKMWE